MTKYSKAEILLVVVLSLSLLGIAAQFAPGIYNRYIYDDFCEANAVRSNTFGRYVVTEYLQWTGRYSGIILRGVATAGGPVFSSYLPYLFLMLTMLAACWCLFPLVQKTKLPKPKLIAFTLVAFFLCTLYGILPKFFESVFWKSSSTIYTPPLILFFLQVGMLLRVFYSGCSKLLPLMVLLTFVASGFSEIYNVMQLVLFTLTAFLLFFTKSNVAHKVFVRYLFVGFITAFLGTLIHLFSPGNVIRQAASHNPDGIPLIEFPYQLLRATLIEFYVFVIHGSTWLIPLSLFPFVLGTSRLLSSSARYSSEENSTLHRRIWRVLFWIGAAVLIIATASAAPSAYYQADAPVSRSMIMILPIFMISLSTGIYALGWKFSASEISWKSLLKKIVLVLAFLTFFIQVGSEVYQATKFLPVQKEYARAWDARDLKLKILARQGIDETGILILTNAYGYSDLSETPKNWVNRCFAEYYEIESITGIPNSQ